MSTNQVSDNVVPNVGRLDGDFRNLDSDFDAKVEVLRTLVTHMTNLRELVRPGADAIDTAVLR